MSETVNTPHAHDVDAIRAWIRYARRRGLRPRTIGTRRRSLAATSRLLPNGLLGANTDDLERWDDVAVDRVTDATRANYIAALHGFYAWALSVDLLDVDPSTRLEAPRLGRKLPRPLPAAPTMAAVARLPHGRERLVLLLALGAGLRCHEIAGLRRSDLITGGECPVLHVRDGKGGKDRVIPVPGWLAAEVATYGGPTWVIPAIDGGRLTASGAQSVGRRGLAAVGVRGSMHQLRHTFLSGLYALTLDIRFVQDVAGHASPATTAGYAAWSTHGKAEAVEKMPAPGERLHAVG